MDLSTIKPIPDHIIKAIGDTLIHSLWQGLLLAIITGLIVVCTRGSAATRRYNLLIGALILFAAASVCTFVRELSASSPQSTTAFVYHGNTPAAEPLNLNQHMAVQKQAVTDVVMGYINSHSATIVLIWFLVVVARSLQLLTGLHGLYHYRRKALYTVDATWKNRVNELALALGIRQMVAIAESGLAKVPMVIGHLKPLILIPVGLMTAMPPEEIEAILVHELAHISRRDYLANLLQNLLEIVFFFNPAVLWISSLIKAERENCCDDIVVAQTSNKGNYIRALVSCQEYQLQAPAYAMALAGKKGSLTGRVKRILSNNNQSLNIMEKSILAVCLVAAGLLTAAFTNADKINKLVTSTKKAVTEVAYATQKQQQILPVPAPTRNVAINKQPEAIKDTTTKSKFKIYPPAEIGNHTTMEVSNAGYITYLNKEEDGVLYQLNFKDQKLQSVQVDGKTLSAAEMAANKPLISQLMMKHDKQMAALKQPIQVKPLSALTPGNYNIGRLNDSIAKLSGTLQRLNAQRALALGDSVNQAYKKAVPRQLYRQNGSSVYSGSYTSGDSVNSTYKKAALRQPFKQNDPSAYAGVYTNHPPYGAYGDDDHRKQAIDDMLKEGIINTRDNLSFKLSTEEFVVNGKKQPDDVYQRYRARYVKLVGNNHWSWFYNYDTSQHSERNSVTESKK